MDHKSQISPIFMRGARGKSKDRNEEVQEKLEAYNPVVH